MFTIKTKIILSYVVVFGFMLSLFGFIVYRAFHDAEMTKINSRLQDQGVKLAIEIREQLEDNPDELTPSQISHLATIRTEGLYGVRYRVLDGKGRFLVSDTLLERGPQIGNMERDESRLTDLLIEQRKYRQLLAPIKVWHQGTYILQLAAPMLEVDEALERLRLLFMVGIPVALLLASVAAYVITRSGFKPIVAITETARKISGDNLDTRIQLPKANDEIRMLAETFNGMIDRIYLAFQSQRQFIADASHEFRTPLTVICSELEHMERRTTDEDTKKNIRTSLEEIDRLSRMTDGMLTLSKLDNARDALNIETVRLDEVLVECVRLTKTYAADKGIDLQPYVEEAVEIQGDQDKLKSAILNLLNNAFKYTPPGGTVSASLAVLTEDRKVVLEVRDTGAGIDPSDLPHIFKRFYRPAESRGDNSGSGLGLAIVEQVIEAHGGTVSIQSQVGKGTTVCAYLPIASSNSRSR